MWPSCKCDPQSGSSAEDVKTILVCKALHTICCAAGWAQVLLGTLLSRQPRLRKAAADTLRHLAERDADSVLAEQIETVLFSALDSETGKWGASGSVPPRRIARRVGGEAVNV